MIAGMQGVNTGIKLQRVNVGIKRIEKVLTKSRHLPLVEPTTRQRGLAGPRQESRPSLGRLSDLLFRLGPVDELGRTLLDSLLAIPQNVSVPRWGWNLIRRAAKILPNPLQCAKLLCGRHLVKRQGQFHRASPC